MPESQRGREPRGREAGRELPGYRLAGLFFTLMQVEVSEELTRPESGLQVSHTSDRRT